MYKLNINKDVFRYNLELTKAFCQLQIEGNEQNNAKVLRSYNPILNDKPLFSFEVVHFDFEIEPNLNYCTLANWSIDPIDYRNILETLFDDQLAFKKQHLLNTDFKKNTSGRILFSEVDSTVIDGASEVQSLGLIDVYDIPPIDTWFYLHKEQGFRLLFAWIPDKFVHHANEAILVNCLDCIHWFEE